ncbi:MAG: rhodanese-like domain-containing protein, partial [Chloroflexi bacterium]|nr:rhodanese-like domain-containing protein [Chloroflexota bacterium]
MKTGSKFIRIFASLALLSLVAAVAACSSNSDSSSTNTPTSSSNSASGNAAAKNAGVTDRGYAHPERLVSATWLSEHLDDDNLLIVDLRGEDDYNAGHIPGAVQLTPGSTFQETDANGVAGMLPAADHIAAALSAIGAKPTDTIVFYDGSSNLWSSRALWALDVYRHADTRLLDGAWNYWSAHNLASTTDATAVTASNYAFSGSPNTQLIANWEEVLRSVDDPSKIVCDTRSPEEYSGQDVRAANGGHIPESVNVNWNRAVNAEGEFLTSAELKTLYEGEGIQGDK